MVPAGAPLLGFRPPFWKLSPPPPWSHLGPWLSRFDHAAHIDLAGLQIKGQTPIPEGIKSFEDPFTKSLL